MSQLSRIKIFGERNTGTNFVERELRSASNAYIYPSNLAFPRSFIHRILLKYLNSPVVETMVEADRDRAFQRNFDSYLGWKHARVPIAEYATAELPANLSFLTLRKNPYSFLLSLYRRPYSTSCRRKRAAVTFLDFLKMPWTTVGRECAPSLYDNPIQLWNDKVSSYTQLDKIRPAAHVRYEDLLDDPTAAFANIGRKLSIDIDINRLEVSPSAKGDRISFNQYRLYYLEEQWRRKLSRQTVATINRYLDPQVVLGAGYRLLDPEELECV